jgi:hypothetical protein
MKPTEILVSPKTNKPLKKSQLRVLRTCERLGFEVMEEDVDTPATRINPYSGALCKLTPFACMLHDFIVTRMFICGKDFTRQDWDTARYMFNEFWPDEYYKLID